MPSLRPLWVDLRHAQRSLRRAWRQALAVVLTLGLGGALAFPLIAAARAGLAWQPAVTAPDFGRAAGGGTGGWSAEMRLPAAMELDGIHDIQELLIAAGVLLLGATCVNAGSLVLARAAARRHARTLHAALGATPARLALQAAAEGVVLAGSGAALAFALGGQVLALMRRSWPWWGDVYAGAPSGTSLALGIGAPAAVVLLGTLLPALRTGGRALQPRLGPGERATPGRYDAWLRRVLVVAQFSVAMGLLVGAGVLVRGALPRAASTPPGFDPRDTLALSIRLPSADAGLRARAMDAALARVRALSGVRVAALSSPDAWLNLGPQDVITSYCLECGVGMLKTPVLRGAVRHVSVSPGWFAALRVPLLAGRVPDEGARGERQVMVNQALAGRLFPGGDPVGKHIALERDGPRYRVTGVVGNVAPSGPGTPFERQATVYLPIRRHPPGEATLLVRVLPGNAGRMAAPLAQAVRGALPGARLGPALALETLLRRATEPLRWFGWVLAAVALSALALCSGGMYAVVAHGVRRRGREIGVRMALGAQPGQVVRHVLGDGARLARTGTLLGAVAGVGVGQTLAACFRGVRVLDAPVWLGVPLLLAAVTLLASWRPARRAAALDPAASLRGE